jgi:hypothetical protein
MRDARWKLHGNGKLHDVKVDPLEERPLAAGAEPAEAAAARKRLEEALATLR